MSPQRCPGAIDCRMQDAPHHGSGSPLPSTGFPLSAHRSRSRWIVIASITTLLLYVGSPYYAFWRFTTALRQRDAAALEQRVDFPALRKSMKQHLNARIAELRPQNPKRQKLFDAVSNALGASALESIVDAYLTPDGLAAFLGNPKIAGDIAAGRVRADGASPGGSAADVSPGTGGSRALLGEHIDWSKVRYAFFTSARDFLVDVDGTKLRFRLSAFGWRLRGVEFELTPVKR